MLQPVRGPVADQMLISRWSVAVSSAVIGLQIANRSQQGCKIPEPKCWWKPVDDQSATDQWLPENHCNQSAIKMGHGEGFRACSKDWLHLVLIGEHAAASVLVVTFIKPYHDLQPLCDCQFFQIRVRNWKLFSYFLNKTYLVGIQKNRLIETVLLSTQNTCLNWWIRK